MAHSTPGTNDGNISTANETIATWPADDPQYHLKIKAISSSQVHSAVGPLFVVIAPPGFDLAPRILQTGKPVGIQVLVAQASVEAFDMSVLLRLAWLNMPQAKSVLFAPGRHRSADELRAVIDADLFRPQPFGPLSAPARAVLVCPGKPVSTFLARHSRV